MAKNLSMKLDLEMELARSGSGAGLGVGYVEPPLPRPLPIEAIPIPPLFSDDGTDVQLTAAVKSVYRNNGSRVLGLFVVRLAQLIQLVGQYRRLVPHRPFLDRPGRLHLEAQLKHWLSEMPAPFPTGILPMVVSAKDALATPTGLAIGGLAYFLLMYYAVSATLSSPADDILWSGKLDMEWVTSPAFLVAQEHAINATRLLAPIVQGKGTMPQMCLPFFQWCVARTGLIHHSFLRSLVQSEATAIISESTADAIALAKAQVALHTEALRKAQGGVGIGDRQSWWFEAWISVTGME